ncbi:hypothetical protein [Acinetobacter sp. WZC-1]|uniref:hypothetical protein n=1 Tax=Acinetobacter sp. WZC-1 TaxID=3459034 RepID=UPI00403E1F03
MTTTAHLNWQTIRQYIWLIASVLCLVIALIFWIMTDSRELVKVASPIEETQTQIQPEKVAASSHLGSLTDEVRPLELTTRVIAAGNHEAEFQGTKFIQDNKKNWTLELFRVTDEDIIRSFLQRQQNRHPFIYFRLSGEDQVAQYILGYGVFKSEVDAAHQLKQLKLGLPDSIHPRAVQLEQFASLVNDLSAVEMQGTNKLYEVRLRPAALPVIDESLMVQPKPAAPAVTDAADATTKTTITRKDSQGNVVDVQRSHTAVMDQPKPQESRPAAPVEKKPAPQEISDPFN